MRLTHWGLILTIIFSLLLLSFGVAYVSNAKGSKTIEILLLVSLFGLIASVALMISGFLIGKKENAS